MNNDFLLDNSHPLHHKCLLGIDFGEKFIGLAVYTSGKDPYPLPFDRLANRGNNSMLKDLISITQNEFVDAVVVGLPFLTDGKATTMTSKAREFYSLLTQNLTIPVYEQDETLSTFEAKERMKNSPRYGFQIDMNKIDALSASIILEDFIIRCKRGFLL